MSKNQRKKPKIKKSTYIDGIAASEHLDSSGERIEIRGIDISSLTVDGVLNYEHKSNEASQIVGKIIHAKKIYERKDCENDRQRYFWDKIKTPYLYIIGELFDAVGHQGAKDVAAMLRYDEMKKEDKEEDTKKLINFSIEGQKLDKRGSVIKKCIARKVSITITPCNKVCEAEELKDTKDIEKSDNFSITQDLMKIEKGEKTSSCQLLKAEFMPKRTFTPQNAPAKIKVGDRIDHSKQPFRDIRRPKPKTGREIYGEPPKEKPTPSKGLGLGTKPAGPPKISDAGQKHAQTDRRYATIGDKSRIVKNNMRKAIIASTGMGAPSTKVNDLNKEHCNKAMETTCEPKADLMKPKLQKAKVDQKLQPEDRRDARKSRKMQSTSSGYSSKDATNRSKLKAQMGKSVNESYQGKNKRASTFFEGSFGKSEAQQILDFVQKKYPDMKKSQQIALAKTVSFLRKSKK